MCPLLFGLCRRIVWKDKNRKKIYLTVLLKGGDRSVGKNPEVPDSSLVSFCGS